MHKARRHRFACFYEHEEWKIKLYYNFCMKENTNHLSHILNESSMSLSGGIMLPLDTKRKNNTTQITYLHTLNDRELNYTRRKYSVVVCTHASEPTYDDDNGSMRTRQFFCVLVAMHVISGLDLKKSLKKKKKKTFTAALRQCNWAIYAAIRKYTVGLFRSESAAHH